MTGSYGPLAAWYDALTRDVDYAAFADFYEQIFRTAGGDMRTLLDLCCGSRVIIMTEANSSVKSRVLMLLPKLKTEDTDSLCVA